MGAEVSMIMLGASLHIISSSGASPKLLQSQA
jgi:hypothetical protein